MMSDGHWFIGLLIIVAMFWFVGHKSSGTLPVQEATSQADVTTPQDVPPPTPAPPPPAKTQAELEAERIEAVKKAEVDAHTSPLKGKLMISALSRGSTQDQEYVTIQAAYSNTAPVVITGLAVKSEVSLLSQTVPKAWTLPYLNASGAGDTAALRPGERAYLISGRSPLGNSPLGVSTTEALNTASFQINACTGFFEQGFSFYPSLPRQCPSLMNDPLPLPPNTLSDACLDYIRSIPSCSPPTNYPQHLSGDGNCQAHVFKNISYSKCVEYHKNEPDFFKGEWHMYFGRSSKLWRDRNEVVSLYDAQGRLIDQKSY